MAPETEHQPNDALGVLKPSMRPGQDGPGNLGARLLEKVEENRPSMRPGQDGPGNSAGVRRRWCSIVTFNEAGARWPRKLRRGT